MIKDSIDIEFSALSEAGDGIEDLVTCYSIITYHFSQFIFYFTKILLTSCLTFLVLAIFPVFSHFFFIGLQPGARPFCGSSIIVVGTTIERDLIFCNAVAIAFFLVDPPRI